jgi:hypothetical protein
MNRMLFAALSAITITTLNAQSAFTLATTGCPAIHCTPHEDDATTVPPPVSGYGFRAFDSAISSAGSGAGVGCSTISNTSPFLSEAGCVYNGSQTSGTWTGELFVYNQARVIQWTDTQNSSGGSSGGTLGAGTCSAPVFGSDGGVLMADEHKIERFDPNGNVLWSTPLPYDTVVSANGTFGPTYTCAGLKVLTNGSVVIKSLRGPLAAFNSANGALLGPGSCPGANTNNLPLCAVWPSQTIGTFSASADYYVPVKEGGAATTASDPTPNRMYDAGQGTGGGGSPSISQNQAITFAVDVSATAGIDNIIFSTTYNAQAGSSPMITMVGGNTVVFHSNYTCVQTSTCSTGASNGNLSQVIGFVDNGSTLTPATGFPVSTASITATSAALSIQSGGTFASGTVTFPVTSTTGCISGENAQVVGNSISGYNGNWNIASGGIVTNTSIKVNISGAASNPGANGTIQCNNAGLLNGNFPLDTVLGCFWINIKVSTKAYCISPANGTTVATLNFPAGFIPGETALNCPSDRTLGINPANGHTIMLQSLSGNNPWVTAVDTSTGALLWYFPNYVPSGTPTIASGQFPTLISARGLPIVGFSNNSAGMKMLGSGGSLLQ